MDHAGGAGTARIPSSSVRHRRHPRIALGQRPSPSTGTDASEQSDRSQQYGLIQRIWSKSVPSDSAVQGRREVHSLAG